MNNIHLASEVQTNLHKPLVAIYWDLQNVHSMQGYADLLLAFAHAKGRLISTKVYYNSLCKNQSTVKDALSRLGFNCCDVPCPLKNSADNQLKADGIDDVFSTPSPNIVILVSGDGDFAKWVCNLQNLDKKVIIFAQRGNVKQMLVELVKNDFHFVDELPKLLEKTQIQTTLKPPQIPYEDATEYLIAAIKTALSQGKCTRFSLIDNLMRRSQRSPNYQGVSSIRKPDGTTFSRFSQFIDAVVADGKVHVKILEKFHELFLIEEDRLTA
jgi:hypothetical protein